MGKNPFDETDWKLIGIIVALVSFIFITGMTMVNASQAKQDNMIYADHQEVIEIKTQISAIQQHNTDEDKRLERIENKIDTLISRGS